MYSGLQFTIKGVLAASAICDAEGPCCISHFGVKPKESSKPVTFNRVLVLDAAQRSALAVTRSLGRAGIEVSTADALPRSLAGCSRYSHQYYQCPSSEKEPSAFVDWLSNLLTEVPFDMVLPVTEITSQLLLINRVRLGPTLYPFADYDVLMSLADKGELVKRANELGLRCPESRRYRDARQLDIDALDFPLVLKPCLSKVYAGGGWISTRVRVLYSKEDLERELRLSPYLDTQPFLLQEYIPGKGAGVFCLYDRGRAVSFFAHRRLREKPPEGGVSVLSESVSVDSELKEFSVKLLDSVGWHGVAMVEFRVTDDGTPYLMEVNTRFWGSLQLAVDSGVDFPLWLWQIESQDRRATFPDEYVVGQRLRWLLGDLDSLYLYWRGDRSFSLKLRRLLQFIAPQGGRCRHEINRLDDMGPARFEFQQYIKQLLGQ